MLPTTPLLTASDLRHSYKLFKKKKKLVIFSVKKFPHPIQRAFIRNNKNGLLKMIKKKKISLKDPKILSPLFMMLVNFIGLIKNNGKKIIFLQIIVIHIFKKFFST